MQRLLFSGLLGSGTPEAIQKFYRLHPKLRMKSVTFSPLLEAPRIISITNKDLVEFIHKLIKIIMNKVS